MFVDVSYGYFKAVRAGPHTEKEHRDISFTLTSSKLDDWLAVHQFAASGTLELCFSSMFSLKHLKSILSPTQLSLLLSDPYLKPDTL